MPFDLFISHSSKDNEITHKIHDRLSAAGIETWVDFIDIRAGDDWEAKIQNALHNATRAVIVLSQASLASRHCKGEWQTFVSRDLPFYILKVGEVKLEDIPYSLTTRQITDLTIDADKKLTMLIEVLGGRVTDTPSSKLLGKIDGGFPRWHLDIPIYGREDALSKVRTMLDDEKAPHIVQITGIGGVGKSRLAAEIVNTATYLDGAIWHDCRISSLTTLAAMIREHLGLSVMTDEQTWDEVNKHALLVVLDNGEDCTEPTAYSDVINRLRGQVRVILTSRMRWNDLRAPELSLDQPDVNAAIQIMEKFAAQKAPDSDLKGMAAQLADAAHRHPRMMEHAASWLNDMKAADVLAELQSLKSPNAQEALHEMIIRSVERVRQRSKPSGSTIDKLALWRGTSGQRAIRVLRKLGVFQGGFTLEAANAIAGSGPFTQALQPLRNWGLLRFDEGRYDVDPLVVQTLGKDAAAYKQHFKYYRALATEYQKKQDYRGLDPEAANLEAAFKWAVSQKRVETALWFAIDCSYFLANRGRYSQRLEWLQDVDRLFTGNTQNHHHAAFAMWAGNVYTEYVSGDPKENLQLGLTKYEEAARYYSLSGEFRALANYSIAQMNLGRTYADLSWFEDRKNNLHRSLAAFEQALRFHNRRVNPNGFPMIQANLGSTYRTLSLVENRRLNLEHSIAAYERASQFYTPENAPLDYANVQSALAYVYQDLAQVEDRRTNLRRAIAAHEQALRFYTEETAPLAFANTQNGMGEAYQSLSLVEDRLANLRRAIAAHEQALRFYTEEAFPSAYAWTQTELGFVYQDLSLVENRLANLHRAIAAHEQALRFYTEETFPSDYARTQNALGITYRELASVEDRASNLQRAVAAHEQALRVYTIDTAALNFVWTQNSLGLAYWYLAKVADHASNLQRAIAAYTEALRFNTVADAPFEYATTQLNLGLAYWSLAEVADRTSNLQHAITAYTEALRFNTVADAPFEYATTQTNLGYAYHDMATVEDRENNLQHAVTVFERALSIANSDNSPLTYADAQEGLGTVYNEMVDHARAIACWCEAEKCYRRMDTIEEAERMARLVVEAGGMCE